MRYEFIIALCLLCSIARASDVVLGSVDTLQFSGTPPNYTAYFSTNPPPDTTTNGIVGLWAFNDAGSGTALDTVGANNGTVYTCLATNGVKGITNTAYYFNGSSSYITIPDNASWSLGTNDFTIGAWVKRNAIGNDDVVFVQYNIGAVNDFAFAAWVETNDKFCFLYSSDGAAWVNGGDYTGSISISTNWTYLTLVRTNTVITSYVNGVLDRTFAVGTTSIHDSSSAVTLGLGSSYLAGRMDRFRLHNLGQPSNTVHAVYNTEKP